MFKSKIEKIIFGITLLSILLFALLAILDSSLIIGWMIGLSVGVINILITIYTLNKALQTKTSKNSVMIIVWVKFMVMFIINGGIIISIIYINKALLGLPLAVNSLESALRPINLFTYIGALIFVKMLFALKYSMKKGN